VELSALRTAVAAAHRSGEPVALADAIDALADALADAGEYEKAACLLGGAEALRGAPGAARAHAVVEEALGTVRLAELTAAGARLPYQDLVDLALNPT
jgi:hypothetical protein